jgi:hypothetical protein
MVGVGMRGKLEIPNPKSQISNPKSQISNLKSQISILKTKPIYFPDFCRVNTDITFRFSDGVL